MLIIQEKLVSDDVVQRKFICDLSACKGACCVQGDTGAPLEDAEIGILEEIYPDVAPYLTEEGKAAIAEHGVAVFYEEQGEWGTTLINGGACAFICFDQKGTALCGIEKAHRAGKVEFLKPISCHLYPIRVEANGDIGFEALNYDEWDICDPACRLGEKQQVPVYQFLQEPITRKYGADFYAELDATAQYLSQKTDGTDEV